MDGALGSRGAALLAPNNDDPHNHGLLRTSPEHIRQLADQALLHGYQLAVHAIGDSANRIVLDAYEAAFKAQPPKDARFRIEHAQILDPADIPRFKSLGVIPAMQASHQTSDMYWAGERLGEQRLAGAYAWQSLLKSGVIVPNGSDFPVEKVNPLISFHAAISRQDDKNWPEGGWHPAEMMTRDQALLSMTMWPAMAAFQEAELGSITVGKRADFTVLDRDIMTVPAGQVLSTGVVGTYVGGVQVYPKQEPK
jgi:predicted amidohydrolase YtcJ